MAIIGFDFGTTNSLVSIIHDGRPINYMEDGQPIPSVACYEGTQKVLGREAKRRLDQAGLGVHGNIVRSPKRYLGRESVFVEGVERSPVQIASDVIGHVLEVTRGKDPGELEGAVVTIPVGMHGYQRKALREAFSLAGLPIIQFVHEPMAALYAYCRNQGLEVFEREYGHKLLLVFDWGGGTLDLTLCRLQGGMLIQINNDGTDEVGGDNFDEAIMNSLIQRVMKTNNLSPGTDIHPGAKARLLEKCEAAKIALSSRDSAVVYLSSFFVGDRDDFEVNLTQEELGVIIKPLLDKGFRRIENLMDKAGYSAGEVALCLATGGMSGLPAIQSRLLEWFGPERLKIPGELGTLIAEGAAWVAHDEARVTLAKTVELQLARDGLLPLLKSGTKLPDEGTVMHREYHLFCSDPRDGTAKFQVLSPTRPGGSPLPNEPRRILGTMTVEVQSDATVFEERIELNITIDDNLILRAEASSLIRGDQDSCEIHDLEFGLSFGTTGRIAVDPTPTGKRNHSKVPKSPAPSAKWPKDKGQLMLRSNLAETADWSIVPGELLHTYGRHFFDVRLNLSTKIQRDEFFYYEPCSLCGRVSRHTDCAAH